MSTVSVPISALLQSLLPAHPNTKIHQTKENQTHPVVGNDDLQPVDFYHFFTTSQFYLSIFSIDSLY